MVSLWRGQTADDPRPNKALDTTWLPILLHGYKHRDAVLNAAINGVSHPLNPHSGHFIVPNHRSTQLYDSAFERSISEGQAAGSYLILRTDVLHHWNELHYSPFGCIPKKDVDPTQEVRLIHDLSFPRDGSVNATSHQDALPQLEFEPVSSLARRIEDLHDRFPGTKIRMMKGDVKGAFRHIPVTPSLSRNFVGAARDHSLTIIDLSLPFGWTGSPAHYGTFGGAISYLITRESPMSLAPTTTTDNEPFFSYVWVDDHVLIEPDRGHRLELANTALRLAMMAVLGPHAINEKKFSQWETTLCALGLMWDTHRRRVSMPMEKLQKAVSRIDVILSMSTVSKHDLSKLLGSLRHVATCVRSTRAFFQRLHTRWATASQHQRLTLSTAICDDLLWVRTLLCHGAANDVPTSILAGISQPQVHLFMDASDEGLCVLYPAMRQFVRVRFDAQELSMISSDDPTFSINVRESLSVVFAAITWGRYWLGFAVDAPVTIRCWLDNMSAVSWFRRRHSNSDVGQQLVRVLACTELAFKLSIDTRHLPGAVNILADRGSRAWSDSRHRLQILLSAQLQELQRRSLADSSRRVYLGTWKQWKEFCARHTLPIWLHPDDFDGQSLQLTLFALDRWRSDTSPYPMRYETIRNKLSHIGWCHRLAAGFSPQLQPQHKLVFDGLRRISGPPTTRGAVTHAMLSAIVNHVDYQFAHHRVICGATLLGFHFCLRGSEYLATNGRHYRYCLQVGDVHVLDAHGSPTLSYSQAHTVKVVLRGSKTDQVGHSTSRSLCKSTRPPLCPVFGAILLLLNAKVIGLRQSDPICSINASTMLSTSAMSKIIKWSAAQANLNPSQYSTHSLRAGGATALHEADTPIDTIKQHGRWKSNAYQLYLRSQPRTNAPLLTSRFDKRASMP